MDVEPNTNVEPVRGPQAIPEVPEERPSDCGSLDLANQLQRIHDHRVRAYQNPNTSMAVVGCMLCNLAEYEARLSQCVLEVLRGDRLAAEDSALNMSVIDQTIRIAKVSVQIVKLENSLSSDESPSNPKNPR